MASKPLRPCLHPGCTTLVRSGYCDKHRPPESARRSDKSQSYRHWYRLKIWTDELRPKQLAREPFCRDCAQRGQDARDFSGKSVDFPNLPHPRKFRGGRQMTPRQQPRGIFPHGKNVLVR